MAKDKLFQKRKARQPFNAKRNVKKRKENTRILIVCEGQTEKCYTDFYTKQSDNLICNSTYECGTSPLCVAEHAISLASKDGDYDQVFAVFDGDIEDKTNFDSALEKIKKLQESGLNILALHSTPCFEYWLFLHFEFSRKPYLGIRNAKSAGTQILSELKKCSGMESCEKGKDLNFSAFAGRLDNAIKNSINAEKQAQKDDQRNPSTTMHRFHMFLEKK